MHASACTHTCIIYNYPLSFDLIKVVARLNTMVLFLLAVYLHITAMSFVTVVLMKSCSNFCTCWVCLPMPEGLSCWLARMAVERLQLLMSEFAQCAQGRWQRCCPSQSMPTGERKLGKQLCSTV